jgi:hypothetical protein
MHACVCALRNSPSAYTLRHGREDGTDALRTWELQGSQDGKVLSLSCSAPLLSASLTSPLLLAHLYPSTRQCTGAWARERAWHGTSLLSPRLSVCHRNFAPTRRDAAAARTLACALTRDCTHGPRRCGLHSKRMTTTRD